MAGVSADTAEGGTHYVVLTAEQIKSTCNICGVYHLHSIEHVFNYVLEYEELENMGKNNALFSFASGTQARNI